jgi:ribosomal-protein-alanine N-acetyltransferase
VSALPSPRRFLPHIAPMRPEHVDAIVETEERIYPFPWTRGNFVDSFQAGHSVWICRDGPTGALLAYAVLMLVLDEAHLLNISVVPERQRQGLGGKLLEHLMNIARGHGATRLFLEVRPSNAAGLALYQRHGFIGIGRRKGYYPAPAGREDAIVMARDL